LIGGLALMGLPPFSGFFSKDAILALAYEKDMSIFVLALGTAFLTAFYVTRLLMVAFLGHPRGHAARVSKESPLVMTLPLIVLAALVIMTSFGSFSERFLPVPVETDVFGPVPLLAIGALVCGAGLAVLFYRGRATEVVYVDLLRRRFYIDEFYQWLINWTQELLARIAAFIDRWIIDAGAVRGTAGGTWGIGTLLRLVQVGNLQAYAFIFGLGIVALIYFTVFC
jgi:NADH-quinone oxidoreductase subunit L